MNKQQALEIYKKLPKGKKTIRWIESEIAYETHEGMHTYHQCDCNRAITRTGTCYLCWQEILEIAKEKSK